MSLVKHVVRKAEMGPSDSHELDPSSNGVATCPVCGVMVVRWSMIEGPDRAAYIAAMRFRMAEGRALYLKLRAREMVSGTVVSVEGGRVTIDDPERGLVTARVSRSKPHPDLARAAEAYRRGDRP